MTDEQPTVKVTLGAIYDTVLGIDKKLDPIPQQVQDHETRLRRVESKIGRWAGAFGVFVFVATSVITYLTFNH